MNFYIYVHDISVVSVCSIGVNIFLDRRSIGK